MFAARTNHASTYHSACYHSPCSKASRGANNKSVCVTSGRGNELGNTHMEANNATCTYNSAGCSEKIFLFDKKNLPQRKLRHCQLRKVAHSTGSTRRRKFCLVPEIFVRMPNAATAAQKRHTKTRRDEDFSFPPPLCTSVGRCFFNAAVTKLIVKVSSHTKLEVHIQSNNFFARPKVLKSHCEISQKPIFQCV